MPEEIGVFNVEAKVGLGKCASLPAFEEFVKLSGMNGFASQTVKIEFNAATEAGSVVATLGSAGEETKFVLIQPVALLVKTSTKAGSENPKEEIAWVPLVAGTPEHDRLANWLSFVNTSVKSDTMFGRILIFYDGLATNLVEGGAVTFKFTRVDFNNDMDGKPADPSVKTSWLGVKILIITAGTIPAAQKHVSATQTEPQSPRPSR